VKPEEGDHIARVEAWLHDVGHLRNEELVAVFERTMAALWRRAHDTLGEVTLTAIVDRILYIASEQYPVLSTLKIDRTGIRFDDFRTQEGTHEDAQLIEAMRFVVVEYLSVLGNLTADVLTPALHAQLSMTRIDRDPRGDGRRQSERVAAPSTSQRTKKKES
jgi:hypothetical protein